MNELALFAGAGGGQLASQWLKKWRTICYVEKDEYRIEILKARIRDGLLDDAPIWDDARTFDGKPWRGCVDIITAGFPCQPFSMGGKRLGADDERNLWPDTIRIIRDVKPQWVFLENSPNLLSVQHRGTKPPYIQQVIGELATSGYVGQYGCLSASTLGADHKRKRVWIVAHTSSQGRNIVLRCNQENGLANFTPQAAEPTPLDALWSRLSRLEERLGEPSVFRNDDGLAHRVDRLESIGNGQVPIVAQTAWQLLSDSFK